jgi:hypothetical protein
MDNPAPPTPPPQTNFASANAIGISSDINSLAYRKTIEQAARIGSAGTAQKPILDEAGTVTGYEPYAYDFTGLGENQLALNQADVNAQTADKMAQATLDVGNKYGAQFQQQALDALQRQDPTGFQMRRDLATSVSNELASGSKLTPQEQMAVEQQVRGGQAARGNILGNASVAQEAMANAEFGQKLLQQRLSNASAYVFGAPLSAQYQSLQGAQQGAAPFNPVQYQSGIGVNQNAGAQGAQFASQQYASNASIYNAQTNFAAQTYTSPWEVAIGMISAVGSVAGAAMA